MVKRSTRSNDDTAVTLQKCWLLCLTCYAVFEVNSSDAISVSIGGQVKLPCTVEVGGNVQVQITYCFSAYKKVLKPPGTLLKNVPYGT